MPPPRILKKMPTVPAGKLLVSTCYVKGPGPRRPEHVF